MKHSQEIVAWLTFFVAAVGLYFSYLGYRDGALPPEVFTRLNEFVIADNPISASATFDFSVSNRATRPVFIVKCKVATDGLNGGGGGYSELLTPCGIREFDTPGGMEIPAGQTAFFNVKHSQDLSSYDPRFALDMMGIKLDEIKASLANGPCSVQILVDRSSRGISQSCPLIATDSDLTNREPTKKAFTLVLQTGTGDTIRTPIYLSAYQSWPWSK